MKPTEYLEWLAGEADSLKQQGLYKQERQITSAQAADIQLSDGSKVVNFCANNYLGLANNPQLIAAAKQGLDEHGFGTLYLWYPGYP